MRLSYATLGAFIKYPKESLPKKPTKNVADKKYGIFQNNIPFFKDVVDELGLEKLRNDKNLAYTRHPLAFLVEAADDICYTIIDFEDGINLDLVSEDYALEYLINLVRDSINTKKYHSLQNTKDRISYLRALAIGNLIQEAAKVYIENEEAILHGKYQNSLLEKCKYEAQINDIITLSVEKIYKSKDVVEKEIAGYKIIADLLDVFISAINNTFDHSASSYDQLIMLLLPEKFKNISDDLYTRILNTCNFISGLSDGYAILIHKKIKGIDIR